MKKIFFKVYIETTNQDLSDKVYFEFQTKKDALNHIKKVKEEWKSDKIYKTVMDLPEEFKSKNTFNNSFIHIYIKEKSKFIMENRYYKQYNGNETKEITLKVKLKIDKDVTEEDLDGILSDMASESLCDDIQHISINLKE